MDATTRSLKNKIAHELRPYAMSVRKEVFQGSKKSWFGRMRLRFFAYIIVLMRRREKRIKHEVQKKIALLRE